MTESTFLILLMGGQRRYQLMGYAAAESKVVNMIRVPKEAVFSSERAAEFATREDAQAAIDATEAYFHQQMAAGHPGFEPCPGVAMIVVEVPSLERAY